MSLEVAGPRDRPESEGFVDDWGWGAGILNLKSLSYHNNKLRAEGRDLYSSLQM